MFTHNLFFFTLKAIQNLENNINLQTLDLAGNRIKELTGLQSLSKLEEFWFNDNLLEDWSQIERLSCLTQLNTVYFERNPVQKDINYRRKIKLALPKLVQIDANLCRWKIHDSYAALFFNIPYSFNFSIPYLTFF